MVFYSVWCYTNHRYKDSYVEMRDKVNNTKKTAMITGASRGIGRSIAEKLAEKGYSLILTCNHSYSILEDFVHQLDTKYSSDKQCFYAKQCDASNPVAVQQLFESVNELDVLINNAGISYIGLFHEMSMNDWHSIIDTNLSSVFYHCKYSIPVMLQKHSGKIINISSVWGVSGASMEVAYSASKGGTNALTMALAKELAPSNIQVNAIACGFIDTEMNKQLTDEERLSVIDTIPYDRAGQPEEVAAAISMLLHAPDYLTGQIIKIDGAWL